MNFIKVSLLALVVTIAGCGTVNSVLGTASTVETVAIEFATAKVIEAKGPTQTVARATNIKMIATQIKTVAQGDKVTVAALEAAATAYILKLNLSTSDKILADALMQTIVTDLNAKVGGGLLSATAQAAVSKLMDTVVSACTLYGA